MTGDHLPPIVVFYLKEGEKITQCVGHLEFKGDIPYAVNIQQIYGRAPMHLIRLKLDAKNLALVYDEEKGREIHYHRGYVILGL